VPIERRNVGMVFQSYALFPNMTVAQNVAYGLKVRKIPAAERARRTQELLAMMRIEALAGRRIDQLSGGQRQRVALARAIAPAPRVLLLDEPLTALDAKLRDQLRVEIDRLLRGLGITTLYVTHDQAEAMALGDRIVVMSKGKVAQIGSPREVYYRPRDRFVAEFVGTMNQLEGEAADGMLALPGGRVPWANGNGACAVLFRPEDVAVVAAGAPAGAPAGGGHLVGRIEAAQFLGDRLRLVVDVGAARPIVVETADEAALAPGGTVSLRLNLARLIAV
jgi:putative spermidine/putrescine transport system ATP-binding protein